MTKLKLILGFAFVSLIIAQAAQAVKINGDIGIALKGGSSVSFDGTTVSFSAGTNGVVNLASGDYAGLLGADATYSDITYNPFSAGQVWEIALTPTTNFVLTSLDIVFESADYLILSGRGIASMLGFEDTVGMFSFSADQSSSSLNFSSTTSVPDSGASVALLGLGLIGLAGAARRFKR